MNKPAAWAYLAATILAFMIITVAVCLAGAGVADIPVWNQLTCGNDDIPWPDGYPTSDWQFASEHINEETLIVIRNSSDSSMNVTCLLYDGNGVLVGEGCTAVPTGGIAVAHSSGIADRLFGIRGHGYMVWNDDSLTNNFSLTMLNLGALVYTTSWTHEVVFHAWPGSPACTSPVEWPYWEITGRITADEQWYYGADCYTDLRLANCGTCAVNPHLTMYNRAGQVVVDRDLLSIAPGETMFLPLHVFYVGTDVYGRARISWTPPEQPLYISGRLFYNSGSDCRSLKRYAAAMPGECISSDFVVPYWEGFFIGVSTTRSTRTLLAVSNPHTDSTAYVTLGWTNMLLGTEGTWSTTIPPNGTRLLDVTDIAAAGTNGYGWARLISRRYPTPEALTVNAWCYLRQEGRQTSYPYHIDRAACWIPLDGPESSPLYFDYWQQKASGNGDYDRFTQYLFTNPGTIGTTVTVLFVSTAGSRWTNTVSVPAGGFAYFNSYSVVTNAGTNVVEGYAVASWTNAPQLEAWSVLVQEHGETPYRQAAWATIPKSAPADFNACGTGDCREVQATVAAESRPPFAELSWEPLGSGEEPFSFDIQLAWRRSAADDWGEWVDLRRRTRSREMQVMIRDGEYRFRVRGRTALGRVGAWSSPVTTRVVWAQLRILEAETSPRNLARKIRVGNGSAQQIILYLQPQETSTWYDIGFDTGYLVADDISNMMDNCIFPIYAGLGWTGSVYEDRSHVFTNLIKLPARYEQELHGLYDGMTNRLGGAPMSARMGRAMDYRDLLMANLWPDAFGAGCRSFVDWNQSGDITGHMALVGFIDFHDYLMSNSWIAVYDFPQSWTDRLDSVFAINPGLVTMIYFGMNSSGLWESLVSAWPRRGYDWGSRTNRMFWADGSLYRRVLEEETSITGAYYHILDEATGGVMFCSDSLHLAQPGSDGEEDSAVHERLYSLFPDQAVPDGQPTNRTCLRYAGWNDHLRTNRLDWSIHYLHELMQVPLAPYGAGYAERFRCLASEPDYDGVRRSSIAELYEISRGMGSRALDCDIPVNWGPNGSTYQWSLWLPRKDNGTNNSIAYVGLPTDRDDPFRDDGTRSKEIIAYRWGDFFSVGADSDGDGLVDEWERQWFGTLYWDADDDPDGDGDDNTAEQETGKDPTRNESDDDLDDDTQSNYAESVAGTDMNDASSVFEVRVRIAGPVVAFWTGRAGRVYQLFGSTSLASGVWFPEGSPTSGVDGVMEQAVTDSVESLFMRLQVEMAP